MDIDECIRERFLTRIRPARDLVEKELKETEYDINKARLTFEEEDYKWRIVKSYYAMFHAARALLFALGLIEKKHFAIIAVLEDLNKKGLLESKYANYFTSAMYSREDADYHYKYSKDTAEHELEIAEEFIDRVKKLLDKI